jgi:hypothetical protein
MSELAQVLGETSDVKYYQNISSTYIKEWEVQGMSRDGGRAKLAYDWYGSWTTLYSLYADALLCFHPTLNATPSAFETRANGQTPLLPGGKKEKEKEKENFIPNHIYTAQSRWYETVMQKYGLPLDCEYSTIEELRVRSVCSDLSMLAHWLTFLPSARHLYTKSDWEFQAAAVASKKTRSQILDRVATWLNETSTDRPFTDLYKTEGDGGFPGPDFFARRKYIEKLETLCGFPFHLIKATADVSCVAVIGSHYAFLTLERACNGKGSAAFAYEE